jgi:prepilin-type N-terminal cleavage/methylation domain-containing protein
MNKNLKKLGQKGFSIMELMIVIVLTLIILVAVFSLMQGVIKTANANYELTLAQQGLRNSQEFLTRDILTAGDGLKGLSNIWIPTAFATGNLTARTASVLDPAGSGFTSLGSVVSDNNVPGGTNVKFVNPARQILAGSDRITILSRDASFSTIDLATGDVNFSTGKMNIPGARINDFTAGEIYFISNGVAGAFGTVTSVDSNAIYWANGDAYGLNRVGPTGQVASITNRGTYPVVLSRVKIIHYYVDDENKLVRRVFGVRGGGFIDNVVAENLTALQFRYILKPSSGTVIFDQPKEQIEISEGLLVRLIESHLKVETAHPLQDGQKHRVDSTMQNGVRNIQFLEAAVPRDEYGNTDLPDPGPTPIITPTPTPSPSPTPIPSPTPTPSSSPSPSPSSTPRPPTPTPTPRPPTPTPTPRPPTPTPTPTPSTGEGRP